MLDHLLDSEGPQNVAQILAGPPLGTARNTLESCLKRMRDGGQIQRTAPGMYQLAPVPPAEAPNRAPSLEPVREDHRTTEEWFAALEAHAANPASWNAAEWGPTPDAADTPVPAAIKLRFNDRVRKRRERRRNRAAAAARQAEADRELHDRLIEACAGNGIQGPPLNGTGGRQADTIDVRWIVLAKSYRLAAPGWT